MISLKQCNLRTTNCKKHKWNGLEEMLALQVALDNKLINLKDKSMALVKSYKYAKLNLKKTQAQPKISNYDALINGKPFCNCNILSVETFKELTVSGFKESLNDISVNYWSHNKNAPFFFEDHKVELLYSFNYIRSSFYGVLNIDINYFLNKICEYKKNIFDYVSPQHFVEHTNAIGLLDKIIFVTKDEIDFLKHQKSDFLDNINDFMGMIIYNCNSYYKDLNMILNEKNIVKKNDTVILLCIESIEEFRLKLKKNNVTLIEMVNKVFSHEIGHLAFAFYKSKFWDENYLYSIAEKQANWISSLAHKGKIDDLIEEVCSMQPYKYRNPILLKHSVLSNYTKLVEDLYCR